jgi:hypothetical protein
MRTLWTSLNLLNNYRDNAALGRITNDKSTNSKDVPKFTMCLKKRLDLYIVAIYIYR